MDPNTKENSIITIFMDKELILGLMEEFTKVNNFD
jgi:hypothetical protein